MPGKVRSVRAAPEVWARIDEAAAAAGLTFSAFLISSADPAPDAPPVAKEAAPRSAPARRKAAAKVRAADRKEAGRKALEAAEAGAAHLGASPAVAGAAGRTPDLARGAGIVSSIEGLQEGRGRAPYGSRLKRPPVHRR